MSDILNKITTIVVFTFPLISIIGVCTNALSYIVFSRRRFQNTIFRVYFRFLIITDTFALLLPINKLLEWNFNIYISDHSNFLCKLRSYFAYTVIPVSGWMIVIISLDRMLSILYPARFLFRKNKIFQVSMCLSILVYLLIFYSPILSYFIQTSIYFDNETNITTEWIICQNESIPIEWLDMFQSNLVPFSLMITFSSLTIRSIFRSRSNNISVGSSTKKKDIKFAVTSISLNLIYLFLNFPYLIFTLLFRYISTDLIEDDLFSFLLSICFLLIYLNITSVFYINIIFNSMFRREFLSIYSKTKYGISQTFSLTT